MFAKNFILLVNTSKTKAVLVHNVVAPPYPRIKYMNYEIEFVNRFKYLGIDITTKLGWSIYIGNRLKSVSKIFNVLRIIFREIPLNKIQLRRKLFFAYGLPHFIWLFSCWLF